MKINKSSLLSALTLLKPGLAKNDIIEGANSFIFLENSILSYNDRIQVEIEFKTGLNGAVPSQELYNLLSKIPDEEIEIINDPKVETGITIKGKRKKAVLVILDVSEMLSNSFVDASKIEKWKELPKDFSDALKFCLFSCATEEGKGILTCLYIVNGTVISSDNNRVTCKDMKTEIDGELLIPGSAARELVKYSPTTYSSFNSWLHFKTKDNVYFSIREVEGKFPGMEEILKVEGKKVKLPKSLDSIIDRAVVLADKESQNIDLIFSEKTLTCKGIGSNGEYEEQSNIVYSGPEMKISVNPEFLKQVLSITNEVVMSKNRLMLQGDDFAHVMCINE